MLLEPSGNEASVFAFDLFGVDDHLDRIVGALGDLAVQEAEDPAHKARLERVLIHEHGRHVGPVLVGEVDHQLVLAVGLRDAEGAPAAHRVFVVSADDDVLRLLFVGPRNRRDDVLRLHFI